MFFQKYRRQKNMAQQMKGVLSILLVGLIIYISVSILLLEKINRQAIAEMSEMSELYTNELDNRFFRISRSMFYTVMKKDQQDSDFWKSVEQIRGSKDSVSIDYAVTKFREHCFPYTWEYGMEYQFFLYMKEEDKFIKLTTTQEGYDEENGIKEALLNQIAVIDNTSYSVKKKWNIMSWDNENYICKIAQNQDIYLGCYVNVKSILTPFTNIIMGEDGYVCLVDANNRVVGELTSNGIADQSYSEMKQDRYSIRKELDQAPFRIQMRISGEKMMDVMRASMIFLLVLASILLLAGAAVLIYLRKYLLLPVQRFTNNLIRYDEGDYTFNITESNLMELEQIDDRFKRMIHQIKRLKITLYEQELEKQKIEMDYLKLQIRPHFYLNCLNFIHSMIDFSQYSNARRMTEITADYLQYVFRNVSDLVTIKAEIAHCRSYLDILLLRYPESFEYYFEIHEEVEELPIFPFLIQVFVENTAKHALTMEEKILVSVTAFPEEKEDGKYINLYISDTGPGFPKGVLKRLKQGKGAAEKGYHVGIENCLKRFLYYYKDKGEIFFDNSPLGGAIVDIHIPLHPDKKGESYESAVS